MDMQTKKLILCRLPYIAENTTNIPQLLTKLLSCGVIVMREKANIMSHPSDYDRCVDLCSTLLSKGAEAYDFYLNALQESGNDHVKEEIEKELTDEEKKRSIDECFYNLDTVIKGSKAERKLQFYQTLGKVNKLVFQPIGVPGKVGIYNILWHYYVLSENSDGERLFRLSWQVDRLHIGYKALLGFCRPCSDTPRAYTKQLRLCKNLFGKTVMEINTPASTSDINVGNDFVGSIRGNFIRNAENQTIWKVNRSFRTWNVYDFSRGKEGPLCAQFGFNCLPNGKHGLVFRREMNSECKAILFGAAVAYMDKYNRDHTWGQFFKASRVHIIAIISIIGLYLCLCIYTASWINH